MRRPRNRTPAGRRSALLLAVAWLLSACGREGPPGAKAPPLDSAVVPLTEDERAGERVFREENCGRCHTLFDRVPASGTIDLPPGPSVDLLDSRVGPDLGREGHRHSDDWHYAHLYSPGVLVPGSRMPASRHLFRPEGGRPVPTPQGRDLVAYLQTLGRAERDLWAEWRRLDPDIPPPPRVDDALTGRGQELYRRHCAPCHGERGDGKGDLAGFFGFPPRDFVAARYRFKSTPGNRPPEDADLFRSITLGTGTGAAMPGFYWLSESERWALVLAVKEFSPALRGTGLRAGAARPDHPSKQADDAVPGQPDESTLLEGRRAWNDLGCASCHGPTGKGMTPREAHTLWTDEEGREIPRSGDLTHPCSLRGGASRGAIERALIHGVGEFMPSYADALPAGPVRSALLSLILTWPRTPDRPSPTRSPAR